MKAQGRISINIYNSIEDESVPIIEGEIFAVDSDGKVLEFHFRGEDNKRYRVDIERHKEGPHHG